MEDQDTLIYQRLRDCRIPAAVLDTIMASEEMKAILLDAWHQLRDNGMSEDEIAESVAGTIVKELNLEENIKNSNT